MNWDGSTRRDRLPSDWPSLVQRVKKRDGFRCTATLPRSGKRCPRKGTDVDHKTPGDDHSLNNLALLCSRHHALKSSAEGRAAKQARWSVPLRTEGEHPGALR